MKIVPALLALSALTVDRVKDGEIGLICTGTKEQVLGGEKFKDPENRRFVLNEGAGYVLEFDENTGSLESLCDTWQRCETKFDPYIVTTRGERASHGHHLLVRFDRKSSRIFYSVSSTGSFSIAFDGACSVMSIPEADKSITKF